jgi:hypothetical protein
MYGVTSSMRTGEPSAFFPIKAAMIRQTCSHSLPKGSWCLS